MPELKTSNILLFMQCVKCNEHGTIDLDTVSNGHAQYILRVGPCRVCDKHNRCYDQAYIDKKNETITQLEADLKEANERIARKDASILSAGIAIDRQAHLIRKQFDEKHELTERLLAEIEKNIALTTEHTYLSPKHTDQRPRAINTMPGGEDG